MCPGDDKRIVDVERAILRALCADSLPASIRDNANDRLRGYKWHDEEHWVVYQALQRLHGRHRISVREELPASATKLAFPDVNWPNYFGGEEVNKDGIEKLFSELKSLAKQI
jgi:hypothetical protein